MGYRIGSFNMRNIGFSALSESNERNLEKIAEIIREEEFDIVALQEVLSEGKAFNYSSRFQREYAKKSILMELGGEQQWGFKWADAEGGDSRGEGYAFLWNKKRMRLSTALLDDGSEREFNPQMIQQVKYSNLVRKPYYARFTPQGTFASSLFEIRLICIHTYFGPNDDAFDREIRANEIDTILRQIYPQIADRVYKNDYPSYTIVLGDYNAELYREWHDQLARKRKPLYIRPVVTATNWDDMKIQTVQDQLTTLRHPQKENGENDLDVILDLRESGKSTIYAHNYDHFSYEANERYNAIMNCTRINAVRKYYQDKQQLESHEAAERYLKEVSDHVPIMLSIELS